MTTVEPLYVYQRNDRSLILVSTQQKTRVVSIDVLRLSHRRCRVITISHCVLPPVIDSAARTVIVPKLDDYEVARLDGVDECREAAFVGIRACAAAGDCVVDDRDG